MIEIMIITASFSTFQIRISIFDDYILKEFIHINEDLAEISNKKCELYDLKNEIIHVVPQDEKYRTIIPASQYSIGGWQASGTEVTHINTMYAVFDGYDCLIEDQKRNSDTPFGKTINHIVTYYADIPALRDLLNTQTKLAFSGFLSDKYDPYVFAIYQYLEDDETGLKGEISKTSIRKELASKSYISQILSIPLKKE